MSSLASRFGRWLGRTLAALLFLVVLIVVVDLIGALAFRYPPMLVFLLHELPFRGQQFDHRRWADAGSCAGLTDFQCFEKEERCPRGGMVRDLIKSHLIPQKATRISVTAMLGPAEYQVDIEGQSCAAYSLGMCSGLGWDYDSLYICFAEDDKVARAGHVQH